MHLSKLKLAAVGLFAAAGTILMAVPAGATISPTTTYNGQGVAGYYAVPNANRLGNGDTITGVRTTYQLTPAQEAASITLGAELCRFQNIFSLNGAAAVIYTQWTGTEFAVMAGHSLSTNCLAPLGGVTSHTQIDAIPAGDTLQAEITVSPHHVITFTDSDQTTQTGGVTTFGGFTFGFDRAGVGANGDNSLLTAPALNQLASFTLTSVRDQSGWALLNRSNLTRLVVNKVVDTSNGTSAGQVLITPGSIGANSGNFPLYFGNLSNLSAR